MPETNSKQLVSQVPEKTNEVSFFSAITGQFGGGGFLSKWQADSAPEGSGNYRVSSFLKETAWRFFLILPVLPKIYQVEQRSRDVVNSLDEALIRANRAIENAKPLEMTNKGENDSDFIISQTPKI